MPLLSVRRHTKRQDIHYLADQVTRQEAGIYHDKVLTLSRANKSVRLFAHVVEHLLLVPNLTVTADCNWLSVRTTAVYGNGKFGIADVTF